MNGIEIEGLMQKIAFLGIPLEGGQRQTQRSQRTQEVNHQSAAFAIYSETSASATSSV